jgi:ABC-type spermidine/putrescine transport system permease subunit I
MGYVNACVVGLSKRLGKTHNWVMALKEVGIIHRFLRDGDPSFEQEVIYATRRGDCLLNFLILEMMHIPMPAMMLPLYACMPHTLMSVVILSC